MKRFWIFAGSKFYPSGGMADFVTSTNTIVQAFDGIPSDADWWHIFDSANGQIVGLPDSMNSGCSLGFGPVFKL